MNSDPDAPMDHQLLQLERELFSLSPVETPRHLAARLDRQVAAPVSIGRQTVASASGKVVPFQWRRIVVPAAAAVVVVSVLNHLDTPAARPAGVAQSNPVSPDAIPRRPTVVETPTGYVLRSEPILINPGTWQTMEQHYFLQPAADAVSGYNTPQRSTGIAPVVFH